MSNTPVRTFSANAGQASTGNAGPDAIEASLDSLINAFIAHKQVTDTDHDGRYYTEAEIDAMLLAMTQGAVAPGSITNGMLATDVKVGSLATLNTTDKTTLTAAINELVSGKMAKSTLTTQGDIIYASAPNTPARLAKGTAGQVLQMNSGATAPEWSDGVALVKIAEVTLGADTASISFSSIPQTYKHLILKGSLRSAVASQLDDVYVRFNGDGSAIYQKQYVGINAGAVTGYEAVSQTSINVGRSAGNTATANLFTPIEMIIHDYTSAKAKSLIFQSLAFFSALSSSQHAYVGGGFTTATAAVSSLSIFNTGQLLAGSTLTLYGVK